MTMLKEKPSYCVQCVHYQFRTPARGYCPYKEPFKYAKIPRPAGEVLAHDIPCEKGEKKEQ